MDTKGKHVLIVDDSTNNLRFTAKLLRDEGFRTSLAQSGQDALKLLEHQIPDVILLDVIMPDMNGLELCQIIKADEKLTEIPVIFLTAQSGTADLVRGFRVGGADYITKPFYKEELLVRIKNQLKITHLTYELLKTTRNLKEKQIKIDDDLRAAGEIQRSLLPPENIELPGIDVAWEYRPCESVGGDIFNVIELKKDHYAFYMIDVSGHGVPSSLVAVAVTQALQLASGRVINLESGEVNSPSYVLSKLNKQFPFERFDKFFTILYAHLDCYEGTFTYSHAGHPLGFVVKGDMDLKPLDIGGSIIGVSEQSFNEEKIKLRNGDKIILYTDGVTEHQRDDGEMYGDERLKEKLQKFSALSCKNIFNKLYKDVIEFGEDAIQHDDMSLLGIEYIKP
ncbi:MAG: SpoIIE family protein phosphatase [Chloroflexia bacterium]|nr:SpoIIE family protein phosphatase [Chloroflexia bacterium]